MVGPTLLLENTGICLATIQANAVEPLTLVNSSSGRNSRQVCLQALELAAARVRPRERLHGLTNNGLAFAQLDRQWDIEPVTGSTLRAGEIPLSLMDEPIAIIGLDARVPGDDGTVEGFYDLLLAGRSAWSPVPEDRWNVESFWHPAEGRAGSTRVKSGHFLKGSVAAFDAPFFSITAAEASQMDPQQRGLLESAYRALENAGIGPTSVNGSQTGVYVGCFTGDYETILSRDTHIPLKHCLGTETSILSNRVSWFFNLQGPSLTIDTACSSSLVALYQACLGLKVGDTSMALVGGCNIQLTPEFTMKLDAAGVLSPDGKSYSFDERANGYSRGEGFGVVVLKRLSDAIRDGDTIRAVIRGCGSNQDGRTPGITQPSRKAQADLIRSVYSKASLDPSLTRFFEAHGTGTVVGDSIEASAISDMFTSYRTPDAPLFVGAVKSNIGHLEGAAGVASLIKGVLTLERGIIFANATFEKLNPKISESWNLKFPTQATVWPQAGLRRMSINSFGIGGSNVHVVLDDSYHFLKEHGYTGYHRTVPVPTLLDIPNGTHQNGFSNGTNGTKGTNGTNGTNEANGANHDHQFANKDEESPRLLMISAFDQAGVFRQRDLYSQYLKSKIDQLPAGSNLGPLLRNLTFTLAQKRDLQSWGSCIVVKSEVEALSQLSEVPKPTRSVLQARIAFVFTGQGAQWARMGLELKAYPVFRKSLSDAENYFRSLGSRWSLLHELRKEPESSRINDPQFCQPICTVLQVALVDLLESWGVLPHAVVGHSSGEIAAAYAIGAISRESAWRISFYRGLFCAKLSRSLQHTRTGMAAIGLSEEQTLAAFERVKGVGDAEATIEIACMNSPQSQTVSGDIAKIDALVSLLSGEKVFARKLQVDLAYHSRYMEPIRDEYRSAIEGLQAAEPNRRRSWASYFSSTYGCAVPLKTLQTPEYWITNLRSAVRFTDSVTAMLQDRPLSMNGTTGRQEDQYHPITDLLEIGPHGALKGPLRTIMDGLGKRDSVSYHSLIARQQPAITTALNAVGTLNCRGYYISMMDVNNYDTEGEHKPHMLTDLPPYSFDHSKEYWTESRLSRGVRFAKSGRHELLGAPVPDWNVNNAIWRNYIRLSENPWIEDHRVSGDILYPAAGMLVMAIEASRQVAAHDKVPKAFKFKEVSFHHALRISVDPGEVESHFYLRPHKGSSASTTATWNEFQLFTHDKDEWKEHCRGFIMTEYESDYNAVDNGKADHALRNRCVQAVEQAQIACKSEVPSSKVYRAFKDMGLDFGDLFQTLRGARVGAGLTSCTRVEATVAALRKSMPSEYLQPHLVHPTTLDGLLQANLLPLALTMKGHRQVVVPTYLSELWVSADSQSSHRSYLVAAHTKPQSRTRAICSTSAIHADLHHPMVEISGLVLKAVSTESTQSFQDLPKRSFNVDWKPDPTFLSPHEASQVFGLPQLREGESPDHIEECELLCLAYMSRYFSADHKRGLERLPKHFQKYVAWMTGVLRSHQGASSHIRDLENRVIGRNTPEGKLIVAVGRVLTEIVQGDADPLEVLFKDQLAENIYRHSIGARRSYEQLSRYIDALAHKNPEMELLEIGAGTGGATHSIINTLTQHGSRYKHYTFTDISPSFLEQAKVNFEAQAGKMSFHRLDIEGSPQDQDFAVGQYDVVVAANVLHATKNIDESLKNAKLLLKPGGKLILYEVTDPSYVLAGFVFGLLPGWWLSEDADRDNGPLMSMAQWESHLVCNGFRGLDVVLNDFPDPKNQYTSILVSGVPEAEVVVAVEGHTVVLTKAPFGIQQAVAEGIATVFSRKNQCNIREISEVADEDLQGATCVFVGELDAPVLSNMTTGELETLKRIVKHSKKLCWVCKGGVGTVALPDMELITGLSRAVRTENFDTVVIGFEDTARTNTIIFKTVEILERTTQRGNKDSSFRILNDTVQVPRLVDSEGLAKHIELQTATGNITKCRLGDQTDGAFTLEIGTTGLLDTLRLEDDPVFREPLKEHEIEIKVKASGINFRDLAFLLGKIDEGPIGLEASGVVTRTGTKVQLKVGDEVFGLFFGGSLRTHARTHEGFVAKMLPSLTWDEAAAIPLVYSTAFAVLHELGTVRQGNTILIHSAAGGLGQATIRLAQLAGLGIFATVGSTEKRDFLEKTYGIPRSHIFSSRDLSFKSQVLLATQSRGVDVVVNSLSGEALQASWDCVAPFGRFVELGLQDINSNSRIPMGNFDRNCRFEALELTYLAHEDPARAHQVFQRMVGLLKKEFTSVSLGMPVTSYPYSQVQEAFRFMQSGKHIGKLVLQPLEDDLVPIILPRKSICRFESTASYVVAGGLGGLGRSIVRWMVSQGAKNLILLSRRGAHDASAKAFVAELAKNCHHVATPACDVTDIHALKRGILDCTKYMPPIKGCIQGSMVLRDYRFEDMTIDKWNEAVRPKVAGSQNLFDVLGSELDFFVMLSSTAGITGHKEQSNYAAGNTFQDAFGRYLRQSFGLNAVSICVPVIVDVGFVAEKPELLDSMLATGWSFVNEQELLAVLDYYCRPVDPRLPLVEAHAIPRLWLPQYSAEEGSQLPTWPEDPLFSHLVQTEALSKESNATKAVKHAALISAAASVSEAEKVALDALLLKLSKILSFDIDQLDAEKPLLAYGVDSLVAVELRSWFYKELGADLSVFEMTNKSSIFQLAGMAASRSRFLPTFEVDGPPPAKKRRYA
ncbi:Lovastatin diketide synthase LovF 5 [Seiridium cupressi]